MQVSPTEVVNGGKQQTPAATYYLEEMTPYRINVDGGHVLYHSSAQDELSGG